MEYVIVSFPQERQVFIDGELSGMTAEKLRVDRGVHTFHLGDPRDYQPKWRRVRVFGTTVVRPISVAFDKVM